MLKYSEWVSHSLHNLIRRGFAWSNTLTFNSAGFAFQMSLLMVWKSQQSHSSCASWKRQWRGFPCGVKSNKQGWTFVPLLQSCLFHLLNFDHPSFNLLSADMIYQEGDDKQISPSVVLFQVSSTPVSPCWCCWLMLSGLIWSWQWDPHLWRHSLC